MRINNLFFHIHYCNYRQSIESGKYSRKVTRTLQHHELIFIKGGKGYVTINDKSYQVNESMLFYICPNVPHSIEIGIDEMECFLSVHFSYAQVGFNDGRWDIRSELETLSLHAVQELKNYYHIEDIFKKLVDSWNAKLPGYDFVARTQLQQLLIVIYQNIKNQNQNYSTSLRMEKIIEYMHQNMNNKITMTELSELVQLSPSYISKAFKEASGYSVIEYFNKIKIDKAKELLIEGDKKVKEVARALGFIDEFYFSRIFKRIEGISPSEFYSRNVHGK